jgi:hypothetical protein
MNHLEIMKEQSVTEKAFRALKLNLPDPDTAGMSNEKASHAHDVRNAMAELLLSQALSSLADKRLDAAKKAIDEVTDNIDPPPDTTVVVEDDGLLCFQKKRNKSSPEVKMKDFIVALASLGVSKEIIDTATERATKERKGNLYYIVAPAVE